MKALVVDDEKLIVKGLKFSLEQEGYEVDCAYDGQEAVDKCKEKEYDIVLLDLMLPILSGYEVCQQVREFSDMPIIMLTAKGDDMDKILGLEYGADDYITKPFEKIELLARIQVQLRISSNKNKNLKYKDIELLEDNKTMKIQTNKITLTRTEYTIMRELLLNPSKVVTKTRLLDLMSIDSESCDESSLKVHISNIRKKIRKITQVEYLEAVWGIGFKIKE